MVVVTMVTMRQGIVVTGTMHHVRGGGRCYNSNSSHGERSKRLNDFAGEAVTIEVEAHSKILRLVFRWTIFAKALTRTQQNFPSEAFLS